MVSEVTVAHKRTQGILCVIVSMAALSTQDMIIKWLSTTYPLHEIIFTRAAIAVFLTLGLVHLEGGLGLLRSRRPHLHVARGLLLVLANFSYFLALAVMPLAEAVAIFFVAPLIITALSVPLLGERIGPLRGLAVLAGLAGVIIMLRPGLGDTSLVVLLPLLAAFCYALMQITTRRLGVTDKASVMAFYVQLTFFVFSAATGLIIGDGRFAGSGHPSLEFLLRAWTWPSAGDALLFLACGCLITVAAYLLSHAYRTSEATLLAPFEYTSLPLAVIWGLLLWGDWPDPIAFLGIALIVGGGLLVFYREAAQGRILASRRPLPPDR